MLVFRDPLGTPSQTDRYALVKQGTDVWDGSDLVDEVAADRASYAIPLTDPKGIAEYAAAIPGSLPAGLYSVEVWQRLGASPASTDRLRGLQERFEWDGAAELGLSDLWTAVEDSTLTAEEVWTHPQRTVNGLGNGQYQVTVTVQVAGGAPVPGARITFQDADGINVAWGDVNAAGQEAFGLDPGSYTVLISAGTGYAPFTTELTVAANASVTYTLTAQPITPPSAAGLCTVQFVVTLNKRVKSGYKVKARLLDLNSAVDATLLSLVIDQAVTDAAGVAELQLVQQGQFTKGDGRYEITVEAPDGTKTHKLKVLIPNTATANFEDLIP